MRASILSLALAIGCVISWLPGVAGARPAALGPAQATNLVINGDFELITGSGCQYNLANALYGTVVANSTAFGGSNEIDVMSGGSCYGLQAISGATKVALHTHSVRDELSLDLSAPIQAGKAFNVSFWALAETSFTSALGTVEIGISTSPGAMGTVVASGTLTTVNQWTQFTGVFTAPHDAAYLTVSSGPVPTSWSHVDDVRLESACNCTAPTYCTAKTNSLGCVPSIGASGCPSASAASGFTVRATQVINNKAGVLFYGTTGAMALPFQGGFLCVKSPLRRTVSVTSGGNPPPNDCSGVLAIDMCAFATGSLGGMPLAALRVPGTQVNCQWWGRDQGLPAPNNSMLSDGLSYVVCP